MIEVIADKIRGGNRVKRYHTVDILVPETVGHHSANVAMLCALVVGKPSANLLLAALTHDSVEQFTGDIPATAKWFSEALNSDLKDMEKAHEFYKVELTPEEEVVLKQCDMLDLCFKCLEEARMGNREAVAILNRGMVWLQANDPLRNVAILMEDIKYEFSKLVPSRG